MSSKRKRKTPQVMPTRGVMYLRGIHPRTKQLFRALCLKRAHNMVDVITSLMRLYLENPEVVVVRKADRSFGMYDEGILGDPHAP